LKGRDYSGFSGCLAGICLRLKTLREVSIRFQAAFGCAVRGGQMPFCPIKNRSAKKQKLPVFSRSAIYPADVRG